MSHHGGAVRRKRRAGKRKKDNSPGFSPSFKRKINKVTNLGKLSR